MASENLPFTVRNAQDFEQITEAIGLALIEISRDLTQPVTKANLARLAGVHRNTLTFRAKNSLRSVNNNSGHDINEGWPFSALRRIGQDRKIETAEDQRGQPVLKYDEINALQNRLHKAKYVASSWFHRTLDLKEEVSNLSLQLQRLADYSAKQESRIRDGDLEIARLRDTIRKNIRNSE